MSNVGPSLEIDPSLAIRASPARIKMKITRRRNLGNTILVEKFLSVEKEKKPRK